MSKKSKQKRDRNAKKKKQGKARSRRITEADTKSVVPEKDSQEPSCGLCGKRSKLTKTRCCNQWICDDVDQYVLFSYARNSCFRNHDRHTLCSYHYNEGHKSKDWKTCKECREAFDTEDYVRLGTGGYNFEELPNPPKFKPTRCGKCNRVINRSTDGYSMQGGEFYCSTCSSKLIFDS